jgi:hypothetical protein
MREFSTAATRGKAGVPNPVDIEFKLDDKVLTAHPPTTGQVALHVQSGRGGGIRSVTSLFEFFSDILDDDDWDVIHDQLRDGMDVELLATISNHLIGEWSGRPTSPSSGSSRTPNGTGPRSTVKRQAAGRTTSRSRSTASATRSNGG